MRSQQRREQLESERRERERERERAAQQQQQQSKSATVSPVNSIRRKPAPSMPVNAGLSRAAIAPWEFALERDAGGTEELADQFYYSLDDGNGSIAHSRRTIIPGLTRAVPTLEETETETVPSTPTTPTPLQQRNNVPLLSRAVRGRVSSPVVGPRPLPTPTPTPTIAGEEQTPHLEPAGAGAWLRSGPVGDLRAMAVARAGPGGGGGGGRQRQRPPGLGSISNVYHVLGPVDEDIADDGLMGIKSVSTVRVHTTPRARQAFDVRGSMSAVRENGDDAPAASLPETLASKLRASLRSVVSPSPSTFAFASGPARGDSMVLGEEETRLVREGYYIPDR